MSRILVIDDNPVTRELISAVLSKLGHAVSLAADGEAGLKLLAGARYDLLVTDIVMPKADGFEIIRAVRTAGNDLPILATSARNGKLDYLRLALALGASDVISKPLSAADLSCRVERLLAHSGSPVSVAGDLFASPSGGAPFAPSAIDGGSIDFQ